MARDLTTGQRAAVRAVKARRSELGFTQHQLAELANVALRTVGDFERMLTWPQGRVLGSLERSLGWHVGYLADLAADVDERAPSITEAAEEEQVAAELLRALGDELRRLRHVGWPISAWIRREFITLLDDVGIAPAAIDRSPPVLRSVTAIDSEIALEESRRAMTERSNVLNKEAILALHDDKLRILTLERGLAMGEGKQAGGSVAES
jgi:transcriptional regulator with XRE-family HTH domain